MKLRLIFFVALLTVGSFQVADASTGLPSAWIELSQGTGQPQQMRAWYEHRRAKPQKLKFVLEIEQEGPSGLKSKLEGDKFDVLPKQKILLSKTELRTDSLRYFKVRLRIFDYQENLLASDSISKGRPSPTPQSSSTNTFTEISVPQSKAPAADVEPELGGLIIDDTRSKSGRDFYDIFFKKWIAPTGINDYTIVIRELPVRGRFAQVSLVVNDQDILKRFLHPQYDRIEEQANVSIRFIRSHLRNQKAAKSELEDDDVEGSGIF